jgi:hypothetical protein
VFHQRTPKRGLEVAKAKKAASAKSGSIMIGVGGWKFSSWKSIFYPEKLPQSREVEYAASKLTSIEINGTYFQCPAHSQPNSNSRRACLFDLAGETAIFTLSPGAVMKPNNRSNEVPVK